MAYKPRKTKPCPLCGLHDKAALVNSYGQCRRCLAEVVRRGPSERHPGLAPAGTIERLQQLATAGAPLFPARRPRESLGCRPRLAERSPDALD
jgi:hypothetical protein